MDETIALEGFTASELKGRLAELYLETFQCPLFEVNPGRHIVFPFYPNFHKTYQDFEVKKDDIWVVTYPKSGTTWTQEMVWCLVHGLDTEEGKQGLMRRFPFFEWDSLIPPDLPKTPGMSDDDPNLPGNTWKIIQSMASPRTIKSHLQKPLLPKGFWTVKPKIIYVCRDPRDVCISYYYHSVKLEGYRGTLSEFVQLFLGDTLCYSPFWSHTLDFWKLRNEKNILFLRFEDMKADLPSVVKQVANFLQKSVTGEEVERIADHCSFGNMSKNKATNNEDIISSPTADKSTPIKFMRKGEVGDWKNHLTAEQTKAFKEWTAKHLNGTDFPYYQEYE